MTATLTHPPADTPVLTGWLSTKEAAPLLCGITPRSVRNHATVGTRTPAGVVRLRVQLLGGRYYTRAEWIDDYLTAIRRATTPADPTPPTAPRETPDQQAERFRREKEETARRLKRRG